MQFFNDIIAKFKDLVKPNEKGRFHPERPTDSEPHEMSDDEKLDEAISESFPATDSPGHISKSIEDKNLHEL